ncbi:hypothetical protein [Aureliella helgolandensis]|nr:hypothetical protein [Aureliella helgolandensis]
MSRNKNATELIVHRKLFGNHHVVEADLPRESAAEIVGQSLDRLAHSKKWLVLEIQRIQANPEAIESVQIVCSREMYYW